MRFNGRGQLCYTDYASWTRGDVDAAIADAVADTDTIAEQNGRLADLADRLDADDRPRLAGRVRAKISRTAR